MADEPSKKLQVGLDRGLPTLLYTRQWGRVDDFVDEIVAKAGVSRDELGERIEEDGPFADVFWTASDRIVRTSDPDYSEAFGRLVAAALDTAEVNEVGYVVSQVSRLDPLHLRVLLYGAFTFWDRKPGGGGSPAKQVWPGNAVWADSEPFNRRTLEKNLDLSSELAQSAIDRLVAEGFLMAFETPTVLTRGAPPPTGGTFKLDDRWTAKPFARHVIDHIFPNVAPAH